MLSTTVTPAPAAVLGLQIERAAPAAVLAETQQAPATLAATGAPIGMEVLAGFGLIGAGAVTRKIARVRR